MCVCVLLDGRKSYALSLLLLPAEHFVLVVACVHLLLLFAFLRLVSGSAAQQCSGAAVQRWELFCLALIVASALVVVAVTPIIVVVLAVMAFVAVSYSNRKEMSKNDKVNGCAQNTVHTDERTHTHTKSISHRLGLCRAVAHLMALGPMPLDRIYVRKVQNFTCI